jgi:hypothetical protein
MLLLLRTKGENDLIVKSFWSRGVGIFDDAMTPVRMKFLKGIIFLELLQFCLIPHILLRSIIESYITDLSHISDHKNL